MMSRKLGSIVVVAVLVLSGAVVAVARTGSAADDPVITIAGDIAESGTQTMANAASTGDLVRSINPTLALTAGDNAYNDGSDSDYATKYDPTWGSFKSITRPIPGNHEWHTSGTGYYNYFFGGVATPWYAYDIGNGWRAYALNCEVGCSAGSQQEAWFEADLAAHPGLHYIAYTHEPRYTSGSIHSDETDLQTMYADLIAAGGDIWLAGHQHDYERFAKMDGTGSVAPGGLRSFVVGTGGNQLYALQGSAHTGEEFRQDSDYGVLKLTLHADSYDWQFVASGRGYVNGQHVDTGRKGDVLDSGTDRTNNPAPSPATTATTAPSTSGSASSTTAASSTTPGTTATSGTTTSTAGGSTSTTSSGGTGPLDYIYDSNEQAAADHGFTLVDVSMSNWSQLPTGTRAMVWMGDLDASCHWEQSDQTVRDFVTAHRGDQRIFAYNIADEPDDTGCASAPSLLKARTELIHAADDDARTYAILTEPASFAQFVPTVDIPATDPYPCRENAACDTALIGSYANQLIASAGGRQWFGVLQAFAQSPWRWPTGAEEHEIIREWCAAGATAFATFAWRYNGQSLTDHPDVLAEITTLNRQGCGAFVGTSSPSTTTTATATTVSTTSTTSAPATTAERATTTTAAPATTTGTAAGGLELVCPAVANPQRGQQLVCTYR